MRNIVAGLILGFVLGMTTGRIVHKPRSANVVVIQEEVFR